MRKTMARRVEAKGSWPGRGEKTQQPGFGKTLGAKLNAPGWHRKRWTMRSITAVALLGLWMGFSSAQVPTLNDLVSGKQAFIDRMHGFSAHLPPPWRAKVFGNAIILQDEGLHFIIIRGTRYDGNLKQVAQKWVEERERRIGFATRVAGNPPRFAFRQTQHGLVIYGEGLGYPYALDPQTSINFSFLAAGGLRLPDDYREVTAILPGETMAVLVTLLFPTESDDTSRKQMLDIVKSFRFLPLQERMGWHAKEVRDSETGLIAATMHVPEGFAFNAGIIRQGKKRRVAVFLRQGETMLRTDYVDLQTQIIQLPYGGNALSFLIINGQVSQQPQPIVVASPEDALQLAVALWQTETGTAWRVRESMEIPLPPLVSAYREGMRQQMAGAMSYMGAQQGFINHAFIAEGEGTIRIATASGSFVVGGNPSSVAATQNSFLNMEVTLIQVAEHKLEQAMSIFSGFKDSFLYNPEWIIRTMESWMQQHVEENRLVRQMLQEHREANSQMARSWTNLLSDQTYVKDPATGEIFRLYKRSWETGDFWREPVFGDAILGGVKRESQLEELLKMEGWRRMTESLAGFPEMWK